PMAETTSLATCANRQAAACRPPNDERGSVRPPGGRRAGRPRREEDTVVGRAGHRLAGALRWATAGPPRPHSAALGWWASLSGTSRAFPRPAAAATADR